MADIRAEAERLIAAGYRELVLTGVLLGNYGREWAGQGPTLATAVDQLARLVGLGRLRLSSVEPSDLTDELIDVVARHRRVCRHLHLPLQSGSPAVLRAMHRHYSPEAYVELVRRARAAIPGLSVTTDVLVGFPGETERDFDDTLRVLAEVQSLRAHFFSYSKRRGTIAAGLPGHVREPVLRERIARGRRSQAALTAAYLQLLIGQRFEALLEAPDPEMPGVLSGYTDTYVRCVLSADHLAPNDLVSVRVECAAADHVQASVVTHEIASR